MYIYLPSFKDNLCFMNYDALKAFPPSTPCKFKQIKKKAEQVETKKPFHQAPVANSKK